MALSRLSGSAMLIDGIMLGESLLHGLAVAINGLFRFCPKMCTDEVVFLMRPNFWESIALLWWVEE